MTTKKTKKPEIDTRNRPYVSNYPPLKEWLDKHEARCMWQIPMQCEHSYRDDGRDYPTAYVECWVFPKTHKLAVITIHAERHGWEIYTPGDSPKVVETLADAEKRLGLVDGGQS